MALPTPYTVLRMPYVPGATSAHGNPVDSWGTPATVPVHGWAPPSADKTPSDSARDAIERDLDLYAPDGTPSGPKDLWVIESVPYTQAGHAEDYTKGPWQWAAGLRINLVRIEG